MENYGSIIGSYRCGNCKQIFCKRYCIEEMCDEISSRRIDGFIVSVLERLSSGEVYEREGIPPVAFHDCAGDYVALPASRVIAGVEAGVGKLIKIKIYRPDIRGNAVSQKA